MSAFFGDTSALAKRYLDEAGSLWVLDWILPNSGHLVIVSDLAIVEMLSLLARRLREGKLSPSNQAILEANFLLHIETEYLVVPIDRGLLTLAGELVKRRPLRALDAIQLASALAAIRTLNTPLTFISADKNLLAAASAEGFGIDDPTAHP